MLPRGVNDRIDQTASHNDQLFVNPRLTNCLVEASEAVSSSLLDRVFESLESAGIPCPTLPVPPTVEQPRGGDPAQVGSEFRSANENIIVRLPPAAAFFEKK